MKWDNEELSPAERAKDELERELYNMLDQGLGKRDAYRIVPLIDALVTARIEEALAKRDSAPTLGSILGLY